MKIESSYSLLSFNTLGIRAKAEFFAQADSLGQVRLCLDFAKKNNLTVKVLGGGSNVVMADNIQGLVLKYVRDEVEILAESESDITIKVGAGYDWHQFVMLCLSRGWYGLENLAYIPGTVGAAPVQNIGAYGVEVKEFIRSVNGLYLSDGKEFSLSAKSCGFSYRESCFKQGMNGQVLISSVEFTLLKSPNLRLSYAPLDKMAEERGVPTPEGLAQWVVEVRKSKLPDPADMPNAGSFFKNPVVSEVQYQTLSRRFPSMPSYQQEKGVKIPAGWLIDKLGLKGRSYGPIKVHAHQALVLVNNGGGASDVLAAADAIKEAVREAYQIDLEQEPRLFI